MSDQTTNTNGAQPLKFELFLDAIGAGAGRSRNIISLLLTATFIAALSWYNALAPKFNWLSSRLSSIQSASAWVLFHDEKPDTIFSKDGSPLRNSFSLAEFRSTFGILSPFDETNSIMGLPQNLRLRIPIYCLDKDLRLDAAKVIHTQFVDAIFSISNMSTINRVELNHLLQSYDRARIDNSILIRIPILGISFDVNGLAFISALAFCFLYFLLYHSLSRERKNLTLVFKIGDQLKFDDVSIYQLISMRQVLTVPHSIDEYIKSKELGRLIYPTHWDRIKNMFLRALTLAPIVLPVLVWSGIYAYDIVTAPIGNSVNAEMTLYTAKIARISGTVMVVLFAFCVYEWYGINLAWYSEALDIRDDLTKDLKGKKEDPA